MKGKYINFIICSIIILFLFEIFIHTSLVIDTYYEATSLWFYKLLPTLFPLFIITDLLANYGFMDIIIKTFGKIMCVFKLSKNSSYALIMAIFSGFPSNSKFIKELLDNQEINEQEATKLLTMTHFSNPLFIIGTIGVLLLRDKKIAFIILIIHYLTNLINGLLFKNIYPNTMKIGNQHSKIKLSFLNCLTSSIKKTIETLFLIYGIIVIISLFINIISININLSPYIKAITTSLIEITNGIKMINDLNISITIKATLITFFLSFGGISIHLQVMGILSNYRINYYVYLLSRIIHASISSILVYIIFKFIC